MLAFGALIMGMDEPGLKTTAPQYRSHPEYRVWASGAKVPVHYAVVAQYTSYPSRPSSSDMMKATSSAVIIATSIFPGSILRAFLTSCQATRTVSSSTSSCPQELLKSHQERKDF